ncbi:MAG: tRNA (N6-isopentenyl adenosine(37)-C2)-methylthiotransferase MiaB [Treponema sp.]|nr:tRNA (N6-isopentenyl adenosine(37)-C2)-methylthiotransferase MiaB [Treponema sp.]
MTYFFETYGCEMNLAESASVEQLFIKRGWKKAVDVQLADMVVINTCSVRASAEERIYGRLGFFTGLKKLRAMEPGAKSRNLEAAARYVEENGPVPLTLVVMGCMAQRLLDGLKKDWPAIDYVVGTFAKVDFPQIIEAVEQGRAFVSTDEKPVYSFAPTSYEEGAFSTFVPIMHGCNNFCSYCIVPYVRGREVSRPFSQIVDELDLLSDKGVKEITLLGQNVNSYRGQDGMDFPCLLQEICSHLERRNSSIEWVRFESSNPKDFSDELIKVIASNPRICRGLHIAAQHGSDRILKAMNRKYTRKDYLSLVSRIRAFIPDVQLSTDIMLGFPGETEEDFGQVLSLMREVGFESAFMYYYNPREGTPAAVMENQVDLETKKRRLQQVIDMQLEITRSVMAGRVGQVEKVLADTVSRNDKGELLGKTSQNERVAFKSPIFVLGSFVNVRLDRVSGNTFRGSIDEPAANR